MSALYQETFLLSGDERPLSLRLIRRLPDKNRREAEGLCWWADIG